MVVGGGWWCQGVSGMVVVVVGGVTVAQWCYLCDGDNATDIVASVHVCGSVVELGYVSGPLGYVSRLVVCWLYLGYVGNRAGEGMVFSVSRVIGQVMLV